MPLVEQTIESNHNQRLLMAKKIETALGNLEGKTLSILGLAFKPNTDDMRESPAITILTELAREGANFRVYDPKALEEARWRLKHLEERVCFCQDEYSALEGSSALVILTEWNQFRNLDLDRVKSLLAEPFFFDLRNIYAREHLEQKGFRYFGVGV